MSRGKGKVLPGAWDGPPETGRCGSERGKAGEEMGLLFLGLGVKESVPDPWVIKSKIHPLKNRDILTYGTNSLCLIFSL